MHSLVNTLSGQHERMPDKGIEDMASPILILTVISGAAYAMYRALATRKIFVSYYYQIDNKYKNLLKAWSANDKFDFRFADVSADISIKSKTSSVIKRELAKKIKEADVFLVLVGEKSHKRAWVRWEISKARELGKPIVAVKINQEFQSPPELLSAGAVWARSFDYDAIKNAIGSL